tara:strand:- start:439 stop:1773 length:1335 start_codon:yes stop_codon:yes gene_type:complete
LKVPTKDQSLRHLQKGGELCGKVKVPGDKSISHRALLFGSIAKGKTTIEGLLPAEDPLSTAECLRSMGVKISPIQKGGIVEVNGVGLNGLQEPQDILNCGNSGTTMRLIMGLLAGQENYHFILTGDKSLRKRPMKRVGQPLKMMGGRIYGRSGGELAPLSIIGSKLRGAVIGTPVASAQIKSAILLAALNAEGPTTVIEPARSRDHSERMLKAFGANLEVGGEMGRHITVLPGKDLKGQSIIVPGDISSAAFWLVAGSIIPGSELLIENVGLNPTRTGILDVLEVMGADIHVASRRDVAGEPVGDLEVYYKENLKPFKINGDMIPRLVDEIPILSVAACFCNGISEIKGASELRVKETDRLAVMARQLKRMGAKVDEFQDGLTIYGGNELKGCELDSDDDHRIAMSLAIASIMANSNSTLRRSEASTISYPDFWSDLTRLQQKN